MLCLACGGGAKNPLKAATLVYTNPTDASSWRLVQAATSTTTHLVLDLVAPTGASGQGVTLVLTTDPAKAAWSPVSGGVYAVQKAYPSTLVKIATLKGADLRLLMTQAAGTPVAYGSLPVLTVALDLTTGTLPGSVALSAAQGGHLGPAPQPVPITVAVGGLQAQ